MTFWASLLMQLLHLVWLKVLVPGEGLWWEGAALLLGHGQTAAGAKLKCGEWTWQDIKKKKRSNRRNKGFSQVGRTTRESKPGREGEGCWGMRRGKVMMVLWGGALDPSVPLHATLCPLCSPLLTQTLLSSLWIRVNHTIFGWDYVIDTQTMSTVLSDSTLPGMLQLLRSLDLRYHFPAIVITGVYSSTRQWQKRRAF